MGERRQRCRHEARVANRKWLPYCGSCLSCRSRTIVRLSEMSRQFDEQAYKKTWYCGSLDFEALWDDYPPAPHYLRLVHALSRDELRHRQEQQFLVQMARGWEIEFYRRHWSSKGLQPGDIRGLEDLSKIPPYTVYDLRDSIARSPPWGDYLGIDFDHDDPMPLILQTSGGTTGLPRAMLYSPRDREVMNILNGRRFYMAGMRPFDRVQVTLSLGLGNGGFSAREGVWKYSGAIPIMTGSGTHTPTRRQIEIAKAWKTNFLIGFPAYVRHMGIVARDELKLDPAEFGMKGLLLHLGVDNRQAIEELWQAPVYDCYGTNESGMIACDCQYRSGMHMMEDAFAFEIVDHETLAPVAEGARGTVLLTSLFKHVAPVIRFNTHDVSAVVPGQCACGGTHRRLERIFGRSDSMIKLRGVNVFSEAIGEVISADRRCNGEYVCVVERVGRFRTRRDDRHGGTRWRGSRQYWDCG